MSPTQLSFHASSPSPTPPPTPPASTHHRPMSNCSRPTRPICRPCRPANSTPRTSSSPTRFWPMRSSPNSAVAKNSPTSPRSARPTTEIEGRRLGLDRSGHLPAAFFDALKSLKPGEYTKTPVHTPYGWHVIRSVLHLPLLRSTRLGHNSRPTCSRRATRISDDSLNASKASR